MRAFGADTIIERAGVAKMTFYHHFPSKDDLVLAFLQRREQVWTHDWLETEVRRRASTPRERLLTIFDVLDDWFQRDDFDAFVNEHAETPLGPQDAGSLLAGGNHGILAGDLLYVIAGSMGYQATTCVDGAGEVKAQSRIVLADFLRMAKRLSLAVDDGSHEGVSIEALRRAALTCLRRWRNDEHVGRGALAVVMASEWVQKLARLDADLERPVGSAVDPARSPWWR